MDGNPSVGLPADVLQAALVGSPALAAQGAAAGAAPSADARRLWEALCTDSFWERFDQRKPVHAPGAAEALAGRVRLDDVALALALGNETGATVAYKRGEPYARDSVFLSYLDGATLSLNGAELFFPDILEICQAAAPQPFDFVTARLVLEPADSTSPALVADSDMFALQLWGERDVALHASVRALPVTAPRPGPALTAVLHPGDAVYIPQGLECRAGRAVASGAATAGSMYLLLSVRSVEQSLEVSFGRYVNDLLMQSPLPSEADAFLRSAVTKLVVPERYGEGGSAASGVREVSGGRKRLEEALSQSAQALASQVSAAGLREHFRKSMREKLEAQSAQAEKMQKSLCSAPAPDQVLERRLVCVARGVRCSCQAGETVARFQRGSDTLSLPIERSASALIAALSDGRPHRVASLPCEDAFERLAVCQILVNKECVEVALDSEE